MEDLVDLAGPVIEVRELVETFRAHGVVLDGWQETASGVVAAIAAWRTGHPTAPPALARLEVGLAELLQEGWRVDRSVIEQLSADAAALMSIAIPAHVPRPDEVHRWAFPRA